MYAITVIGEALKYIFVMNFQKLFHSCMVADRDKDLLVMSH